MSEWIVTDEDLGCDGAYFNYTQIVRCKDCKSMNIYEDGTWWCEELEREIIDPFWFCAYGERKDTDNASDR